MRRNREKTQQVKLGDVCLQITDGKHGDCVSETNSGYYFISSKDVFDGSIHYENARQITEADFLDTHRRTKLEVGDVLITNSGTIGRMALIKNNARVGRTTFQKSVAVIKPKRNSVDNAYLYYKLLSLNKQLVNLGGGSAQHNLLLGDMRAFTVQIPDLPTQTRIASVLSAYDDLIENNEKRIKTLEEMAQRLYSEWFVSFKFPPRLRASTSSALRSGQAGHEKVKMVDSGTQYGMIPEGWEVIPIKKLANFMNGYPFKPKDLTDHGLPIIKIPELRSGILEKTPRNSGESINKKYVIHTGDILFSWSATLLVNIWNSGEALLNQHLFKVTPKENKYKSYAFYTLVILVERIRKHVVGATMQHLRKDTVESAKVLLPSTDVLTAYEARASKVLEQISLLCRENQNLSKTRDLLIPQLVTGKRR